VIRTNRKNEGVEVYVEVEREGNACLYALRTGMTRKESEDI
jgi:hypothetical protein